MKQPTWEQEMIANIDSKHKEHLYHLDLTEPEYDTLAWLTDRGYFPQKTFDSMYHRTDADEKIGRYSIPEHTAWYITIQREEEPHSLYTCCGDPLLSKLVELENEIV